MRVLVAEDDPDLRDLLVLVLEQQGWEVFAAEDGREALRLYHNTITKDKYFDVLLLDVEMPRLNGFGVGVNVRNLEKFGNVPRAVHVYFTGHDDIVPQEDLLECLFADAYLQKPIDPIGLIEGITGLASKGLKKQVGLTPRKK